jgi:hypothetical protein
MKAKLLAILFHTLEFAVVLILAFMFMQVFKVGGETATVVISATLAAFVKFAREVSIDYVNAPTNDQL